MSTSYFIGQHLVEGLTDSIGSGRVSLLLSLPPSLFLTFPPKTPDLLPFSSSYLQDLFFYNHLLAFSDINQFSWLLPVLLSFYY